MEKDNLEAQMLKDGEHRIQREMDMDKEAGPVLPRYTVKDL